MTIWIWLQPGNKAWKVVSDHEKGTIIVYNEKGEIILEKRGLSKAVISIVEANFLNMVATKLSDYETGTDLSSSSKTTMYLDNPMYV
ncbi:MAG: hypothetical protein JSV09_08785 [Thermoplasmata archaeon]|nr:MAG: hypothetical protein JSV09_08785 [Thermoplasmata archaeon]